ncbi:energy transducer TonB [Bacteroidota bacterium]
MKINVIVLTTLLILCGEIAFTQNFLKVSGGLSLQGENVNSKGLSRLFEKDQFIKEIQTDKSGKFEINLALNKDYIFEFSHEGYITKKIHINTEVPNHLINSSFTPIYFRVELTKQCEIFDTLAFQKPIGIIRFYEEIKDFDYDVDYSFEVRNTFRNIKNINDSTYLLEETNKNDIVQVCGYLTSVEPEIKNGSFKFFSETGVLEAEGYYLANMPSGVWKHYNDSGQVIKKINYDKTLNFLLSDTTYSSVKRMTTLSNKEIQKYELYLKDNLYYPIYALRNKILDVVVISFVIDKNNNPRYLRILSSKGNLDLNVEALRVIMESSDWILKEYKSIKKPISVTLKVVFGC